MNFLLLESSEIDAAGIAIVRGRRAAHLITVLNVQVDTRLRAGVINGLLGFATVQKKAADAVTVHVALHERPDLLCDALLLAVPRPKVLMRMLAHAAAMGFARVVLFRCWRVDKSWAQSRAFDSGVQRQQLLLGLEQAGRTQVPEVLSFDRFKPMIEDELPQLDLPQPRFVAHPYAATPTHQLCGFGQSSSGSVGQDDAPSTASAFTLAIGPDGGFLPYEVGKLVEAGFHAVTLGPNALRTETALAALWAQLDLLRRQR